MGVGDERGQQSRARMSANYHHFLCSRQVGGASLVAMRLQELRRSENLEGRIWLPGHGPAWQMAEDLGLRPCAYDPEGLIAAGKVRVALGNWDIARRLRAFGTGVAHVHSTWVYGLLWSGLRLSGLRSVLHLHLETGHEALRWALRHPPDLIITCAQFLAEDVRRCLPGSLRENQRIEVVSNAVDTARFHPGPKREAKDRVGAPAGSPLALMLANLSPHKGQETAIRTVALLKQRGVDLSCWLAGTERGEQGYAARLQSLIAELGVGECVRLLGYRDDAPELLRAADFFLLPSTNEGLPLSVLEAQATGVPVLAAPTAGIPEVVFDGETGFLIPAGDAEGYARRLAHLLRDAELAHRVSEQAYAKTVRERGWTAYCDHISEIYREIAGPRRA